MNQIYLIGRLTADPALNYTKSEKPVCNFNIAVDRAYQKEKTDFFKIVVFGKVGESCAKFLQKGLKVAVIGELHKEEYTDDKGVKQKYSEVVADKVEFIEWAKTPDGFSEYNEDDDDFPY